MAFATTTTQGLKHLKNHQMITDLRSRAQSLCKDFKISWLQLGQTLHAIQEDKLFHAWGYEKFEDYTVKELGFDQQQAKKLLKSYEYLINEGPEYLKEDFASSRDTALVPSIEDINFLRMVRGKKDLLAQDHGMLKKQVFEKGKIATALKRDLTAIMRERKPVDPIAEQEKRKKNLIKTLIRSLQDFQSDMETTKLVPFELIKEAEELLNKLKAQNIT